MDIPPVLATSYCNMDLPAMYLIVEILFSTRHAAGEIEKASANPSLRSPSQESCPPIPVFKDCLGHCLTFGNYSANNASCTRASTRRPVIALFACVCVCVCVVCLYVCVCGGMDVCFLFMRGFVEFEVWEGSTSTETGRRKGENSVVCVSMTKLRIS